MTAVMEELMMRYVEFTYSLQRLGLESVGLLDAILVGLESGVSAGVVLLLLYMKQYIHTC
jgi:hypothetical protein